MPRGDGTGPAGSGPMTGRASGFCSGYAVPGYMNPVPGAGSGRTGYVPGFYNRGRGLSRQVGGFYNRGSRFSGRRQFSGRGQGRGRGFRR
jgi:hypothetical protein